MATYRPAAFPRRPKYPTIFSEIIYQAQLAYYRYEVNTGQYVMSPGEKWAYNLVAASFLTLLLSAIYYYLPSFMVLGLQRLAYYYTGFHKHHMNSIDVTASLIQNSNDATLSLNTPTNATLAL